MHQVPSSVRIICRYSISETNVKYTLGISQVYLGISKTYIGFISVFIHIKDISQVYLNPISDISKTYLKPVKDFYQAYLGQLSAYLRHILGGVFRHVPTCFRLISVLAQKLNFYLLMT